MILRSIRFHRWQHDFFRRPSIVDKKKPGPPGEESVMSPIFQRNDSGSKANARGAASGARTPRRSSGWAKILERLKAEQGLRVLDIGPTSPANINFLTELGHSVYMADLVAEAVKPDWVIPAMEDRPLSYDVPAFLAKHMDFGGRKFDVILLWDTADYVPAPLGAAIISQLASVLSEKGQVLAFFHSKNTGPETAFSRYHVMDGDTLSVQPGPNYPVVTVYQNRQAEALLQDIGACRFLLAKDNTREVIASR